MGWRVARGLFALLGVAGRAVAALARAAWLLGLVAGARVVVGVWLWSAFRAALWAVWRAVAWIARWVALRARGALALATIAVGVAVGSWWPGAALIWAALIWAALIWAALIGAALLWAAWFWGS